MARSRGSSPVLVIFAVSVALSLTWQSSVAIRNGVSDVYARPAIDYLESKSVAEFRISDAEWRAVHDSVARASQLMPGNPEYLDSLGWMEQIKLGFLSDDLSIDQIEAHAIAAEDYYLGAIAVRPTWPYYWGSLALEMHRRGSYDTAEYSLALANAARFGPWKNDTQRLVADLGIGTFAFLSTPAKQAVLTNLERGFVRQPDAMLQFVTDWQELCREVSLTGPTLPVLSAYCE